MAIPHHEDTDTARATRRYAQTAAAARIDLDPAVERGLARRWRDHKDLGARDALIRAHMSLAVALAHRYKGYGVDPGDLVGVANIGLVRAAESFDPDEGARFATYAHTRIRGELSAHCLGALSVVRTVTSRSDRVLFYSVSRVSAEVRREYPRMSNHEIRDEVARRTGTSAADVERIANLLSRGERSIDTHSLGRSTACGAGRSAAWSPDGGVITIAETVADERESPEQAASRASDHRLLHAALDVLDPRSRAILAGRRLSDPPVGLKELGSQYGISEQRVSQIEARAVERLAAEARRLASGGAAPRNGREAVRAAHDDHALDLRHR